MQLLLVIGTSEKNQTEFIILLERNLKVYIALAIMTDWLLQPVQLPSSVVSALLCVAGPRLARGRSRNDRRSRCSVQMPTRPWVAGPDQGKVPT